MDTETKRRLIEYLARIEEREGRLTPERVVEDARAEDSPLHSHFVWDDAEAARKHRLDQARALIRIRVEVRMNEVTFMAPYFVREPERKEQGYISVERARGDVETAREVLRTEMDRLIGSIKRARAVAAVIGLAGDMDEMLRHALEVNERVIDPQPEAEGPSPEV